MRQNTTRTRVITALVLMAALVVTACGGGGGSNTAQPTSTSSSSAIELPTCPLDALANATAPVDVTVWHTQTARPLDVLKQLVDEYNASQSKVRVHLESQGSSYPEIQKKFNEALPSKQLPAIIDVDDTFTKSMADSGVVLPAQSCFAADGYDVNQLVSTARSYYTINGVLWPASAGIGTVLVFYNRDHFRRAGLDPDKPPTTLAEVQQFAEKLKAAGVSDKPLAHEFSSWKTEFWLTGVGSSVVDNDNGRGPGATAKATLDGNQQALDLFTWFKGMNDKGLLNAVPATPGQINQYLALLPGGGSSMLIDSTSAATSIEAFIGGTLDTSSLGIGETSGNGLDFSAGAFPGLTAGSKTQMGGDAWYVMNTTPPAVQAGAWDFMRFMNSVHAQALNLVGGSYLPWVSAALQDPSVVAYFAGQGGLAGKWLKIANDEVAAIDQAFPGPLIGPYDLFREAVQKAEDQLVFNNASPTAALTQAQHDVDTALSDYNANL
jgi:sn-glycerol 3-phosphate transport system substrate-binding protein